MDDVVKEAPVPTQEQRIVQLEKQDAVRAERESHLNETVGRIFDELRKINERLDEHSDEGKAPPRNTQPGVVVANGLENPTTEPGNPHGRWDPPARMQLLGWLATIGSVVTTVTGAITTGIILGYQATVGAEPPTQPAPIEVEIVDPRAAE